MSILKIRDTGSSPWQPIASIKGEKGAKGETGGNVSRAFKDALMQLVEIIPYTDERSAHYVEEFYNAMYADDFTENFVRVGTPQISDGILTSSSSGWIETPAAFDPGSTPWELTVKLKRPSIPGVSEVFVLSNGIRIRTSWNSANTTVGLFSDNATIVDGADKFSVPAGAWRWLKVAFRGTFYDYGMSTDGSNYTWVSDNYTPSAYQTTTPIKAGAVAFGSDNSIAQFDLRETKITVNGAIWWKPYILE